MREAWRVKGLCSLGGTHKQQDNCKSTKHMHINNVQQHNMNKHQGHIWQNMPYWVNLPLDDWFLLHGHQLRKSRDILMQPSRVTRKDLNLYLLELKAVRRQHHLRSLEWARAELLTNGPADSKCGDRSSDVGVSCWCTSVCVCAGVWVNKLTSPVWNLAGPQVQMGLLRLCVLFWSRTCWNSWNPVCQHSLWPFSVTSSALWPLQLQSCPKHTHTQGVAYTFYIDVARRTDENTKMEVEERDYNDVVSPPTVVHFSYKIDPCGTPEHTSSHICLVN